MASDLFGWTGQILRVDLDSAAISEMDTMPYAGPFLGGRGIATRIYWEEVSPEIKAFDPENRLIFMSGALVATGAQGATRMSVIGKSPMTDPEGFCYGNLGGFFPSYLKKAGFDGIVVSGRSDRPVYILVEDGKARIEAADDLWGKGTYAVKEALTEKHGKTVRFVAVGPAGENKCRSAVVITDHEGSATGGFGAVMGGKNLKAIAVVGTGRPAVASREKLTAFNKHVIHMSKRGTLRMPVPKKQMEFVRTASCFQCAMECGRGLYRTPAGREEVRKCQAMVMYMPYAQRHPVQGVDVSLDVTALCNDYGVCTMEMQNLLLWLEGCYHARVVSDAQAGLEFKNIGTYEFAERLISMIALREGFGDVLAEGIIRAGRSLGDAAEARFSEFTKAVGMDGMYAPREYTLSALLYAMEPRQPIAQLHDISHLIARWLLHRIRPHLSPTTAEVFRKAAVKFWKSEKSWDMTTFDGKAEATRYVQDRTYAKDSLGLCDFGWPIMDSFHTEDHTGDPTLENRLFSIVTGIEVDEAALNAYGERIFNLQRSILLSEGWDPSEDDAPAAFNFEEPLLFDMLNPELIVPGPTEEPVSVKGNTLNRGDFEQMRSQYYEMRGWDPDTGLQKKEVFERLEMPDVYKELESQNLVKQAD